LAAGPADVGEIQAAIRIAILLQIVEPEAPWIEIAARMVVDDIEDHGDAVQMTEVDQAAQLVGAGGEAGFRKRRMAEAGEDVVDGLDPPGQLGRRRDVARLRREIIDAIIAQAEMRLEFLDRQQLQGVDAETAQIVELENEIEVGPVARGADVLAILVLRPEGADVELVDDEIAEIGRLPAAIMPGIGARIAHDTEAVR